MKICLLILVVNISFFVQIEAQLNPRQPKNNENLSSSALWKEIDSYDGNFWALTPGIADEKSQTVPTAAGEIKMHYYLLDKGDVAYFIAYSDYPQKVIESQDVYQLLEGAKNGALGKYTSKQVLFEKKTEINGYPAIMSQVKGNLDGEQITFKGFQLLAANRLYQVYLISTGILDELIADKFINSFVINKSGWVAKKGDNGAFRFSMPGNSTFSSQATPTDVGTIDFNMFILDEGNVAWFATYSDFPKEHIESNDPIELLKNAYDGVAKNITSQKVNKKDFIKIYGYNAINADIEGNMIYGDQQFDVRYKAILMLVENRLYQIYSLSIGDGYDTEKTDYFEASFKLIKP